MCATTRPARYGAPTALPIREKDRLIPSPHGQGYSRFEHYAHGVALELVQFVPVDDPIKISRLKITNHSGRTRRLSITAYVEWVLGGSRTVTAPFVVTEIDPQTGAMFAQNRWSNDFGERVAFADLAGRQTAWTGDRAEFVGRDGALDRPGIGAGRRAFQSRRRGARSVRRAANARGARRRRVGRGRFLPGRDGGSRAGPGPGSPNTGPPTSTPPWRKLPGNGTTSPVRSR